MDNADELKGRAKEAVGDLTDDDKLKSEGKTDKAAGSVKGGIDKVKNKVQDALRKDK